MRLTSTACARIKKRSLSQASAVKPHCVASLESRLTAGWAIVLVSHTRRAPVLSHRVTGTQRTELFLFTTYDSRVLLTTAIDLLANGQGIILVEQALCVRCTTSRWRGNVSILGRLLTITVTSLTVLVGWETKPVRREQDGFPACSVYASDWKQTIRIQKEIIILRKRYDLNINMCTTAKCSIPTYNSRMVRCSHLKP